MKVCRNLLSLYDEMNQLSLIPVNASLFAALLKEESVLINNLTQLYRELTCYLIRRQLSRMGLKELSKVIKLELFDKCVLDCLYTIGHIALMGVSSRELTSTERVTMTINHVEIECHCLGLAHEFHTKESIGPVKKVWAFAHLTMQEFISSIFLKSTSWTDQCLSIRYIADSNEHFSLFKMVVRFLCGLLSECSATQLTILYRLQMPETIGKLPMYTQLGYDKLTGSELFPHTGLYTFTQKYFHLNSILFETNSGSILHALKRLVPTSISIYLDAEVLPVSPNEWLCFIPSLRLVQHIELLYIDTQHVNLDQFGLLIDEMKNCLISQLVVKFKKGSNSQEAMMSRKVIAYTDKIYRAELSVSMRISIELDNCEIKDVMGINLFSSSSNKQINSLALNNSQCSTQFLNQMANNIISSQHFQYLFLFHYETDYFNILLPKLSQATELKAFYVPLFSPRDDKELITQLTRLTELQYEYYSLLPHIVHLTRLTYLEMSFEKDQTLSSNLIQILTINHSLLRVVKLWYLQSIGFKRWTEFLTALQSCVNLLQLELNLTFISSDDTFQWAHTLPCLTSLLYLRFYKVSLYNAGLLDVCQGLAKHRSIKELTIARCSQTSQSCEALTNLIPATRQLERLIVDNLSEPDPIPIEALRLVAEEYLIETKF